MIVTCVYLIAVDRVHRKEKGKKKQQFFLPLHKSTCCRYSLETPQQGAFNEYSSIMEILEKDQFCKF